MAAAQVGDVNAYRILLVELASWLRRYYARRLPPSMTEDAVQDVLLAIHECPYPVSTGNRKSCNPGLNRLSEVRSKFSLELVDKT